VVRVRLSVGAVVVGVVAMVIFYTYAAYFEGSGGLHGVHLKVDGHAEVLREWQGLNHGAFNM